MNRLSFRVAIAAQVIISALQTMISELHRHFPARVANIVSKLESIIFRAIFSRNRTCFIWFGSFYFGLSQRVVRIFRIARRRTALVSRMRNRSWFLATAFRYFFKDGGRCWLEQIFLGCRKDWEIYFGYLLFRIYCAFPTFLFRWRNNSFFLSLIVADLGAKLFKFIFRLNNFTFDDSPSAFDFRHIAITLLHLHLDSRRHFTHVPHFFWWVISGEEANPSFFKFFLWLPSFRRTFHFLASLLFMIDLLLTLFFLK